jgi:hypothetical protein
VNLDGEVWCAVRSPDGALGEPQILHSCAELTSNPCASIAAVSVQPRETGFVATLPTSWRQRIEGAEVVSTTGVSIWSLDQPGQAWSLDGVVEVEFGERISHAQIAVLDDRLALAVQPSPRRRGEQPADGRVLILDHALDVLAELPTKPGRGPFLAGDLAVMVREPALNGVAGANNIELSAFDSSGTQVALPAACMSILVADGNQYAGIGIEGDTVVLAHRSRVYSCDLVTGRLEESDFDEAGAVHLQDWPATPSNSLVPRAGDGWLVGTGPSFKTYGADLRLTSIVRNEYGNFVEVEGERLDLIAASVVPNTGGASLIATAGFARNGDYIAEVYDVSVTWRR